MAEPRRGFHDFGVKITHAKQGRKSAFCVFQGFSPRMPRGIVIAARSRRLIEGREKCGKVWSARKRTMKSRLSFGVLGSLTLQETVIVVGCAVLMGFLFLASSSHANPGRSAGTVPRPDPPQFEATARGFVLQNKTLFRVGMPPTTEIAQKTYGALPFSGLPTSNSWNWTTELDNWAGKPLSGFNE
jgi:hypothetical protein